MTHARERIEVGGVIGIGISFVGDQCADNGGRNVGLVPARRVEAGLGDLIAGCFGITGRLNLPISVEIGPIGRTVGVGGGYEAWNQRKNSDNQNRREGNAGRASHETLLGIQSYTSIAPGSHPVA